MQSPALRVSLCLLIALAAPGTFGKTDPKTLNEVQAVVLDHNAFVCTGCLFGISDYYFCFDVNNKVLVGHDKVRTQTWMKQPSELMERGKAVPIRFDDEYIWAPGPKGKTLKLQQDYTKKIFLNNPRCQAATK